MTTTTDIQPLTREDIKALRTADDSVSFHTSPDGSLIVASKRATNAGAWYGERMKHEVNVDALWTDYSKERTGDGKSPFKYGFEMISSPMFSPSWRTIVSLLKVGDRLRFHWVVDNNSENIEKVGYHVDYMQLVINRADAKAQTLTFNLFSRVGPDNSARMVRRSNNYQ